MNTLTIADPLYALDGVHPHFGCAMVYVPSWDEVEDSCVSVNEYIAYINGIMVRVHRSLILQGICWLWIPDSYANQYKNKRISSSQWAKNKSLYLLPERIIIQVSTQGWVIRQRIIWKQTNSLPIKHTDRGRMNYRIIYLLIKSTHCSSFTMKELNIAPNQSSIRRKKYQGASFSYSEEGTDPGSIWEYPIEYIDVTSTRAQSTMINDKVIVPYGDMINKMIKSSNNDPVLSLFNDGGRTLLSCNNLNKDIVMIIPNKDQLLENRLRTNKIDLVIKEKYLDDQYYE